MSTTAIQPHIDPAKRHDFLLLFDVADGNPNGDPDAGNMPRIDPETAQGLVTDVCLKRKIRNYITIVGAGRPDVARYGIFVREKAILNNEILGAYSDIGVDLSAAPKEEKDGKKRNTAGIGQGSEVARARDRLCTTRYDIRMFGAVMSTGPNAGQVRGPVQLTFGRSVDPITALDVAITRMAVATEKEAEAQGGDNRTMGRKTMVPYGLYVARGFYNPAFGRQTGATADDLGLLWEALQGMWDIDRSAARGMMSCRGLYVFTHEDPRGLGNAPAHKLLETLVVRKRDGVEAPRRFDDYVVAGPRVPDGIENVTLTTLVDG
jgi:CRISPR-associated protein Csd2